MNVLFKSSMLLLVILLITKTDAAIKTKNCEPPPPFNCEDLKEEARDYYDKKGMWSGIYTMEPVRTVRYFEKFQCHIKYFYTPVPGNLLETGYDYRTFDYTLDNKTCKWKVGAMGPYMSGTLAYD